MTILEEIARNFDFSLFDSARELYEDNKDLPNTNKFYTEQQYLDLAMRDRFGGYDGASDNINEFNEWSSYENLSRFQDQQLLDDALGIKRQVEADIDLGGDFEQSRLKFSSIPRGVFSFGLASKGLYRLTEYFDEERKIVVNDKLVRTKLENGRKIFYYNTPQGEREVRKQQKGSFEVSKSCQVPIKYSETAKMFVPIKGDKIVTSCDTYNDKREKIKLEFATSIKKVYMYRDKLGGGLSDYVDLYIPVSFNGNNSSANMISQNLPVLIVADILESSGIKTRVNGIDFTRVRGNSGYVMAYAVKEYGETFDLNKITALTSEQRFIRTQAYLQSIARMAERKNYTQRQYERTGLGSAIEPNSSYFRPVWNTYRNWIFNKKGSFDTNTKILDPNLMIIGGASLFNINTQRQEVEENAKNEVYDILDYIGMMVSKNKRGFVNRIIDRRLEQGNSTKEEIKRDLKALIQKNTQILPPISDDLKMFATPPEIAQRTREAVDELITLINEA